MPEQSVAILSGRWAVHQEGTAARRSQPSIPEPGVGDNKDHVDKDHGDHKDHVDKDRDDHEDHWDTTRRGVSEYCPRVSQT